MKVIFTYTIPHTGTHFVMDLQSKAVEKKRLCRVDDMWWGNHYKDGANFEDYDFKVPISKEKILSMLSRVMVSKDKLMEKWNDLELLLIKGHHWHQNKPLINILKQQDPDSISFVSPLRDPFLAIMTRSWQGWYGYGKKVNQLRPIKERKREASRIVQTFVDILTLPTQRMYLFPIDGENSKTLTNRLVLANNLYRHCGLQHTQETFDFVEAWQPVNTSQSKSKGAGKAKEYTKFERVKQEYKERNIKTILKDKFCNFEFEFLQKEEYLKQLLEKAGYKNLAWW